MPPMTSRRAGAREILMGLTSRASEYACPCHPHSALSSSSMRASRVGTGSREERSGGWAGGGAKDFLFAFEDDAVEKSAAGGGAEHGGQDVRFGFVGRGIGELEGVGAAG